MEKKRCLKAVVENNFTAPLYPGLRISGMTNGAGGFTLIELLVVVLIIGILAAVAVPQYQKAVDKSRMVQLLVINKAVREAEERYYLANGNYTRDWDVLEIGFAGQKGSGAAAYQWYFPGSKIQIYLGPSVSDNSVWSWDTRLEDIELRSVYIYGGQGTTRDGRTFCYAARTNARAKQACLSISSSCEVLDANKYICYVK